MTTSPALLAILMAPAASGAEFHPVNVAHTGSFELAAPPNEAFHLFTAPGEKLWVPDWDPTILSGNGTQAGTVFETGHGNERTIWVVVDFDVEARRARYARTTPHSRAGTVEVRLSANDEGGSIVTVTYELTALNESGNQVLAQFDAEAYAEMMKEWKRLIGAAKLDAAALAALR